MKKFFATILTTMIVTVICVGCGTTSNENKKTLTMAKTPNFHPMSIMMETKL